MIEYETDNSLRMKRGLGAAAIIAEACDSAMFMELARQTYSKQSGYNTTVLYEMCPIYHPDLELTQQNFLGAWESLEPGFAAWFSHGSSYASYVGHYPPEFIAVDALPLGVRPAVAVTSGCIVANPEVESLGRVTNPGANPIPAFYAQFLMGENLVLRRQALAAAVANAIDEYVALETPPSNVPGPIFNQNIFEFLTYGDPAIQVR